MRKLLLTATLLASVAAPAAQAQFSTNIGAVTDYRFHGVSQTLGKPALQGGLDYAHSSGLYIGTWLSTVSKDSFPHGNGLEVDVYAGWKNEFAKDLTVNLGVLYYYSGATDYTFGAGTTAANAKSGNKYNNTELYAGLSYKWLSAKYYYATSNYFGASSTAYNGTLFPVGSDYFAATTGGFGAATGTYSKGSSYLDLSANYELAAKWPLNAHVGILKVKNYGGLNATDYKLGVTYDAGWASLSAAVIGTSAKPEFYRVPTSATVLAGRGSNFDPTKTTLQLAILKTF